MAHAVGLWVFANAGSSFTPPTAAAPLSFDLDPGFNLVAWTAAGSPIEAALAPLGDALLAAFTWDPIGERFLSYRPGVPAGLNTATDLRRGEGLWLDLSSTVQWPPSSSTAAAGCDAASEPQPTIISGPDGPNGPDNDSVFRALAVHPTDADTLVVGTKRNGFVRSTDGVVLGRGTVAASTTSSKTTPRSGTSPTRAATPAWSTPRHWIPLGPPPTRRVPSAASIAAETAV